MPPSTSGFLKCNPDLRTSAFSPPLVSRKKFLFQFSVPFLSHFVFRIRIFVYTLNGAADNRDIRFTRKGKTGEKRNTTRRKDYEDIIRFSWSAPQKDSLRSLFFRGEEARANREGTAKRRNSGTTGHARRRCSVRCSGTTAKKRETRSSHRGPRVNEMPRCETRRPTFAAAFEEVNRGPRSD